MTKHEHKWKFLRVERWFSHGSWYIPPEKWTYVYKVCSEPECFETSKERKEGYWYDKDFEGK